MARLTQQELLEIFDAVKKEIKPYEKGNLKARIDIEGKYDLWSEKKNMLILNKIKNEMPFATIILQSSYVGFYYMPVYTNCDEVTTALSPELLKLLKGKACFHIKTVNKELLKNINSAMKTGCEVYKKNGWL